MALHPAILHVADEMGDGPLSGEITHQGGICVHLGIGQREFFAVTDIFDPDSNVVQANAVPGHPVFRHQAVNGSIAVHQKLRGNVDFSGGGKFCALRFSPRAVEIIPCGSERRNAGPVQNDHPGLDDDIRSFRILVNPAVSNGKLDALLTEIYGLIHNLEVSARLESD